MLQSSNQAIVSCNKPSDPVLPIDSKIQGVIEQLTLLDVCSQEFGFEPSDCNVEAETEEFSDDDEGDDVLPPPKPYYDRKSALLPSQGLLPRSSSSQSLRNKAREFLQSKCMTQSMPNLQSSRSQHNRVIGNSLESRSSSSPCARSGSNRIAEFDVLMEDL